MKRLAPLAAVSALLACGKASSVKESWLTMPDLASHSALYFPIAPGSTHGPAAGQQQLTTCNDCHADRSSGAAPYPPASSFKTYTCTGCHVAVAGTGVYHDDIAGLGALPEHAGLAGFDPAQPLAFDQACRHCHPDGSASAPVYHSQLFPTGSGTSHAGIGCSSCHGSSRADLTQLQCASCHADPTRTTPARHAPTGVTVLAIMPNPPPASCTPSPLTTVHSPISATDDPRACLQCHALSAPVPVSAHPGGNSAFGTGQHKGAGCLTCHTTTTRITAPVTPAPSGYPTVDFSQPANPSRTSTPGCTTCHQSATCGGGG